ncbi:inositol monophosphatase family protein [Thiocapsa marina]|uniref:Inositol monophosphatase n=1 Tax=Thiocapsa marina 5811 TaxID=768671 RepID=F9UFB3_9GAMM|nr:inositol monophosphatase family protein [Thiocapsa marina]EGV17150.1 inositol monophosphatase [Thiocapsa marina 5811]
MTPDPILIGEILREAAATEIMPRFHSILAERKADGSLVTAADFATQARIAEAIARVFPDTPLLGEEMTAEDQRRLLAEADTGVWILDPLDGTGNYASGFPGFSISLAFVERGQAMLGVIFDPVRDECFCAVRGGGATLNGEPIRPFAPGPNLGDCLAMIDMKRLPPERIPALFRPGGFRSQRNLGSVALDWCWLAAGRYQLYLHGGQKLWDYAAGHLIASEAGAASRLYADRGAAQATDLSLSPRLAVAASDEALLRRWIDFVGLPMHPA